MEMKGETIRRSLGGPITSNRLYVVVIVNPSSTSFEQVRRRQARRYSQFSKSQLLFWKLAKFF
jgi:hypothetical protein